MPTLLEPGQPGHTDDRVRSDEANALSRGTCIAKQMRGRNNQYFLSLGEMLKEEIPLDVSSIQEWTRMGRTCPSEDGRGEDMGVGCVCE